MLIIIITLWNKAVNDLKIFEKFGCKDTISTNNCIDLKGNSINNNTIYPYYYISNNKFKPKNDIIADIFIYSSPYNIKIDGIDKGQCVLGIPIKALSDLWDVFVHVDDGIQMILETKKLLYKVLRDLEADLSDFELEQMEGDSIRVFNPEPYLISI